MLGKRLVFVTRYIGEFRVKLHGPAMALIDNTAADDLTKKFGVTPRTAHFLRWQHYLRWVHPHYAEPYLSRAMEGFIPCPVCVARSRTSGGMRVCVSGPDRMVCRDARVPCRWAVVSRRRSPCVS